MPSRCLEGAHTAGSETMRTIILAILGVLLLLAGAIAAAIWPAAGQAP